MVEALLCSLRIFFVVKEARGMFAMLWLFGAVACSEGAVVVFLFVCSCLMLLDRIGRLLWSAVLMLLSLSVAVSAESAIVGDEGDCA